MDKKLWWTTAEVFGKSNEKFIRTTAEIRNSRGFGNKSMRDWEWIPLQQIENNERWLSSEAAAQLADELASSIGIDDIDRIKVKNIIRVLRGE